MHVFDFGRHHPRDAVFDVRLRLVEVLNLSEGGGEIEYVVLEPEVLSVYGQVREPLSHKI